MIQNIDIDLARISPLEDDLFTFRNIATNVRDVDLSLFTGKWFDYRHMTPLQATGRYIACYGEIYRRHYSLNLDYERAEHVKVDTLESLMTLLKHPAKDTSAKIRLTSYWRGRQMADALGMPYEVYIDLAFEYRLRFWKQRYLPRPGHLYDEILVDRIERRWAEMQMSRIYKAEHPAYLNHNYQNIAHQNDHHEWLFEQAGKRTEPERTLARFVTDDLLPAAKVRGRLPEAELQRFETFLQ